LDAQIEDRKAKIDDLQKRIDAYEKNLQAASEQHVALQGDLAVLTDSIDSVNLKLEQTDASVELAELQVSQVEADIAIKEHERGQTLDRMGAILRSLHRQDQVSPLALTLTANSLSDFFRALSGSGDIYHELRTNLDTVSRVSEELAVDRASLTGQLSALADVQERQRSLRDTLNQQQSYKVALLSKTQQSEEKLSNLIESVKTEASTINAEITTLEERARSQIGSTSLGTGQFRWPVQPIRGISAYFHDPTYIFRCTIRNPTNCIGEHNAVDIPTPQGTAVHAADDGYVAIARKLDWVRDASGRILYPAYNYVALLHAENLSTVYGHLSQVLVNQDTYVRKGDVIGVSGATPGTAGAGRWTTGPHLHFEVRVNGIPDDPLKYLP
jgi:murein DD-endopeptidase MepM/ murein hydrolase activator NlpD